MRAIFTDGKGRWLTTAGAVAVASYSVLRLWPVLLDRGINPLDVFQKTSFVAAAFSVTAYNLRLRVLDVITKVDASTGRIRELCDMARACGMRLTNLVVLFTVTGVGMAAGGLVPSGLQVAPWLAALLSGAFAACFVQFLYIVFAFERLEDFALRQVEETVAKKRVEELFPPAKR